MKSFFTSTLAIAAGIDVAAATWTKEDYSSGRAHEYIMSLKESSWAANRANGLMDSTRYISRTAEEGPVLCENGVAEVIPGDKDYTFRCSNIDFYDFQSHADLGSSTGEGASSWGWTSPEGREFIAIAQADGTAFAEVSSEGKLIYLGRLPQYSVPSLWREIRGYQDYAIIGSEAVDHGIQIFDFKKLVDIDPANPVLFDNAKDLTGWFNELPIGRTHNVVINEEKEYVVSVGAQPRDSACASGLIFIDMTDPTAPFTPGCAPGDGYVHDAQCLVYHGPDTRYEGRDICYGYNEDTLTIYDVTEKNNSQIISITTYEGASYTHQGWVLDTEWQEYLVLDDEYDEYDKAGVAADGYPVTYFWDIKDLENPVQTGYYKAKNRGIDHNQYIHKGRAYQSNYGGGLHVLDVSSIPEDPTGNSVTEVGFFDIYPGDDDAEGGGIVQFVGTWSHYPYFKSGFIPVNTMERGAFVVKIRE